MSTHNVQFLDRIRKFPLIIVFWSYRENFVGTQNKFELAVVHKLLVFERLRFDRTDNYWLKKNHPVGGSL